ncbi:MAG: hypothetical protein KatS3mg052_1197 [Candidatus Roseilinea sp.]|nr:MAG: hypothetical protein KatS3mg052_1197 [Candidatus Roseilinea sp.]
MVLPEAGSTNALLMNKRLGRFKNACTSGSKGMGLLAIVDMAVRTRIYIQGETMIFTCSSVCSISSR